MLQLLSALQSLLRAMHAFTGMSQLHTGQLEGLSDAVDCDFERMTCRLVPLTMAGQAGQLPP